jgi:hypothetical protein
MRLKAMFWALPLVGVLVAGCGSGSALVGGVETENRAVALQAVSTKPTIAVSRPVVTPKRLPAEGGAVGVSATVKLKNLTDDQITVTATALDGKKQVVAAQAMTLGDGGVWKTDGSGLVVPPNLARKAVSVTIQVVAATIASPTIKKGLKAGTVTVAKSTSDPNQPPPPPPF